MLDQKHNFYRIVCDPKDERHGRMRLDSNPIQTSFFVRTSTANPFSGKRDTDPLGANSVGTV